ncbi:MAG TPA: proton-conducting transporter membrane subunit, partial [Pyrinomonadaceae bacterium]|nr:proton-conducting transporter membrane subunit [Pyrinomonadaceae bacterium]
SWIALGLFVGACGKSAQLPLHVWLPDAMAGPTPVSALIHAATMVTAGLYMVTRTNVIFQHSQTMMLVVALVGAATAIFAATIGITQNDIKKVLAYSTVSQLGFMFMACGVGAFVIGIFHVMTHAFFKALMFLGAGSVIHGMHHEQDMRRMGGLKKYMPYTYWTFMAGWLAICGIIPFSGFWSKDEILWNAASTTHIPLGWIVWLIGTIAATGTAFYMTRLMGMTFWGKERFLEQPAGGEADEAHAAAYDKGLAQHDAIRPSAGDRPRHEPGEHVGPVHEDVGHHVATHGHGPGHGAHIPHESPPSMWVPLVVLAVFATIGGLVGIGPAFTGGSHPGGNLNIVNWLEPIIWNPVTGEFNVPEGGAPAGSHATPATVADAEHAAPVTEAASHGAATTTVYGDTGFNLAHAVEGATHSHLVTEWIFIIISLIVAGVGILLGVLFYVWRPSLPDVWAQRLRPLYNASYNKYWVDEFYGWAVTRRTMDAARAVFGFDSRIVDGIVNGLAWLSRQFSRLVGGIDKYLVDGLVNTI